MKSLMMNCLTHLSYLCSVVIPLCLPFRVVDSVVGNAYGSSVCGPPSTLRYVRQFLCIRSETCRCDSVKLKLDSSVCPT
ncbi:hypothetical protein L6164_024346 [Bauhinia variegata]|uniref:Uncharacterized protein n=1 Tax=Bauhinia variegata TaxID=167791 RepID=A0ACB9LXI1_BAUVA|nr:hypothetical protein L6164_024346 [Bauhinia variegata]